MRLVYQQKTYWMLLAALFLLTACGQNNPSEPSATPSSTTVTNASNQNTSDQSTATTESTSTTEASTQTSSPAKSSEEDTPLPSSSSAPANKTDSNYIPSILVGEWVGSNPQADRITLSISGNGLVTSTATFPNGETVEWRAIINSLDTVGNATYFITSYSGDYNALLPGATGLGGAGVKVAFGFRIENAQLIPINWIIPEDESTFNYDNIHTFGYALSHR